MMSFRRICLIGKQSVCSVFALVMVVLLLASACSEKNVNVDEARCITLGTSGDAAQTKGMYPLTYTELKSRHFGVLAISTDDTDDFSTTTQFDDFFLNNWQFKDVEKDGRTTWIGTSSVFWPTGANRTSFFAYAPYETSLTGQLKLDGDYMTSKTGPVRFEYTPSAENVVSQLDLCVNDASTTLDKTSASGSVTLDFSHTLTRVNFYGRYQGTLPVANYKVRIEELRLKNVIGTKILTYDIDPDTPDIFTWSADAAVQADTEYNLRLSSYHLSDKTLSTDADIPLQQISGYLYLLPQALSDDASIEILYSFLDNNVIAAEFIKSVKLPTGDKWEAGRVINYYVTLNIGTSSEITITSKDGGMIEDWMNSNNDSNEVTFE